MPVSLSRPFFVNLQIPILSFIDCISIQTIFCPLLIQLGKEIRLETYALQLTFLTFFAGFYIPITSSNFNSIAVLKQQKSPNQETGL